MRQIRVDPKGFRYRSPVERHKLSSQSPCSNYTYLLTQHSPHCDLKTIPATRSAQSRTLRYQWRKGRINRQMVVDGFDISAQIKKPAHSADDGWQRSDLWKTNLYPQAVAIWQMYNFNTPERSINFYGTEIAFVIYQFSTGNRPRSKKSQHAFPVVWRTIAKPKEDGFLCILGRILSS